MAKAHPAKKARFLAGCVGAVGFALVSVAILEDSLVDHKISSSLLQAPQSESQATGINSEAFALQGSAIPADPASPKVKEPEIADPQNLPEDPQQAAPKDEEPEEKLEVVAASDAESDAS